MAKKPRKPDGIIPTRLAKKLVLNYEGLHLGEGAKGIWFSTEVILNALSRSNGPLAWPSAEKLYDGLRFYFGKYEKYDSRIKVPRYSQDAYKLTLVIVPTEFVHKGKPKVKHPYRDREFVPFDDLANTKAVPGYPEPGDEDFLAEWNDGQICPPPPVDDRKNRKRKN